MCIARKEDKENEEGNVKKIRDKKIEKIQKLNRARWNEIESETDEIKTKKIKKKKNNGLHKKILGVITIGHTETGLD